MYPQLSNVADKNYLDMIREIPFQYDLENPVVELKFQAQLSRIVNHYDSLTPAEEAEAVNILMENINNPTVFNWLPVFKKMATGCDVPLPVSTVDDFRFVLMACYEDARRTKARSVNYKYTVTGNSETHFRDTKVVSFKEKNQANPIKPSGKASNAASAVAGSKCTFCGKNNHPNAECRTRTSDFTNNQNRPYIDSEAGSEAHDRLVKAAGDREWIPNFKELKGLMSKAGQSSGPSSSAAKPSKPSKDWKSKGTYVRTILPIKLHIATSPYLLLVALTFASQEEAKGSINLDALLDTGCLAGDFVAR